jgi:hypothetical protein
MTSIGAAALHVCVGGFVDVSVHGRGAVGTSMGAVAVGPAIFERSSGGSAASAAATSATVIITVASTVACTAPSVLVIVIQLALECGDGGSERCHLVQHLLVLLG